MGVHCITGRRVAIKIVNKEKLSESVLQKVEREIAIMKLIEHPHVLHLYDVYENKKYLYLMLEHVSGGELFDYLVRKGRLSSKEARKFFRQIISALDFCHAHNICHRDLKPENLLLDERTNIKVADFGMASLQVEGSMLETSCGSPHYACPEVIRGEKYDGRKADVWSCGVILYALLVGALPFDDDNLRNLLEKVKKGLFHIPHFVPPDCQSLLRGMIEVDPSKRLSLADVFRHHWVVGSARTEPELELPMGAVVETHVIPSEDHIDPDVLRHMTSLGCFKDRAALINELLSAKHNTEKMVYYLLLDRKRRRPATEDETEVVLRNTHTTTFDPPRKRTDTTKWSRYPTAGLSEGSPINPRKNYGRQQRPRHHSLGGSPNGSPRTSPMPGQTRGSTALNAYSKPTSARGQQNVPPPPSVTNAYYPVGLATGTATTAPGTNAVGPHPPYSSSRPPAPPVSPITGQQWRSKLNTMKNTFFGTPRFHRRKMSSGDGSDSEDSYILDTSDLVKKSWFGSLTSSNSVEREDVHCVPLQGRSLNAIKAELIRAFLTIHELSHSVIGQNSFRVEYKRGPTAGGSVFSRGVRMQVDILLSQPPDTSPSASSQPPPPPTGPPTYVVQFTLIAGPVRRFRRLADHLTAILQASQARPGAPKDHTKKGGMVRPRRLSDSSVSSACSDSEGASLPPGGINLPHVRSSGGNDYAMSPRHSIGDYRAASQERLLRSPMPARRAGHGGSNNAGVGRDNPGALLLPGGAPASSSRSQPTTPGATSPPQPQPQPPPPIPSRRAASTAPAPILPDDPRFLSLSIVGNGKADRV